MDIQMPRADGIETSRELYRRYRTGERPTIIALTANATAGDREKCQQAGMLTHIAKPILPNDLATALMSTAPLSKNTVSSSSNAGANSTSTSTSGSSNNNINIENGTTSSGANSFSI